MPDLMPLEECETIFDQVAGAARSLGVGDVEAILGAGTSALTRFANNTIHQNVAERTGYLSVRALIDGRTARATTNALDRDSIRHAVEQAVAITRLAEPDPDLPRMGDACTPRETPRWFEATGAATPEDRAAAVAKAIEVIEGAGQT